MLYYLNNLIVSLLKPCLCSKRRIKRVSPANLTSVTEVKTTTYTFHLKIVAVDPKARTQAQKELGFFLRLGHDQDASHLDALLLRLAPCQSLLDGFVAAVPPPAPSRRTRPSTTNGGHTPLVPTSASDRQTQAHQAKDEPFRQHHPYNATRLVPSDEMKFTFPKRQLKAWHR